MPPLKRSLVLPFMLVMALPVQAQDGTATASDVATGAVGAHTAQDVRFVMSASAAGSTEVIAARLAQQQGQSAKVKNFAATMLRDHTKANQQLRQH